MLDNKEKNLNITKLYEIKKEEMISAGGEKKLNCIIYVGRNNYTKHMAGTN